MRYFYIFLLFSGIILVIGELLSFHAKVTVSPAAANHKAPIPTIAPQVTPPSAPAYAPLLYYEQTPDTIALTIVDPATGDKQGVYDATVNEVFENFLPYNQLLYIKGNLSFGILNLLTHFFYHIDKSQIPLISSPDQSKAVYFEAQTAIAGINQAPHFTITQPNSKDITIQITQSPAITYQPLCWINNNTAVLFRFQNQLFMLNLSKKTFTPDYQSPQQTQAVSIFCNPVTNILYFLTKSGIYRQQVNSNTVTEIPNSNQFAGSLTNIVFPYNSKQQDGLIAIGNTLLAINLVNGTEQTIYSANQSATVTPFFWDSSFIIFTTKGVDGQGKSYLEGDILNQKNMHVNTFATQQSSSISQVGTILPITLLPRALNTYQ